MTAVFHSDGTSRDSTQRAKILQCGSTRFRCLYSTLSGPGLVLAADRSFCLISCADGARNRDSSHSTEGTTLFNECLRAAISHGLAAKMFLKKVSAALAGPEKFGESSSRILRMARFLEWR